MTTARMCFSPVPLALALALLLLLCAVAQARPMRLCHTNDFHARYTETDSRNSACDDTAAAAGECYSGIARIASAFKTLKCDLRIQAGDMVQGTVYDTVFNEQIAVAAYRWARYDIATLGNHEFDKGNAQIYNTVTATSNQIMWLNANVNFTAAGPPPAFAMTQFADMRGVCWFSVVTKTTAELARPDRGTVFGDETVAARRAIRRCAQRDRVIAITHQGYEADLRLCRQVKDIDLIIGGHSHTNLDNGAYPTKVTRADGSTCFVAQAYAFGRYVGVLDVEFDDAGAIALPAHQYVPLDWRVAPDAATAAGLAVFTAEIGDKLQVVVGEAAADIDGTAASCRAGECMMGNLVADAMLREGAKVAAVAAFINGGGVRSSIAKGPITIEEIFTVLPFGNVHAFVTLSGEGVVAALEHGFTAVDDADNDGRFPQVAGMNVTADLSAAPGKRVSSVTIGGKPVVKDQLYKIVTNDYLAGGGDGYRSVGQFATDVELSGRPLYELLKEYLEENNPYTPFVEGRIVNTAA